MTCNKPRVLYEVLSMDGIEWYHCITSLKPQSRIPSQKTAGMGRAMDNRRVCVCVSAGDHHQPTLKTLKWKFWNIKKEKKVLISNSRIHSITALIYYAAMSHCWRGRRLNSIFHVRANLATYFTLLCTIFVRPWPKPFSQILPIRPLLLEPLPPCFVYKIQGPFN